MDEKTIISDLISALNAMLDCHTALMPGLAKIAVQDYTALVESPQMAHKAIEQAQEYLATDTSQDTDHAAIIAAVAEIAGSHGTNNEMTDMPVWWVIAPRRMIGTHHGHIASMVYGPFWSRQNALEHLEYKRHHYGNNPLVYCSPVGGDLRELYRLSKALNGGRA